MKNKKFIEPPRHFADLGFLRRVWGKLNALLNARIVDQKGNVIGDVLYADGNTLYRLTASAGGAAVSLFAVSTLRGGDYFLGRQLSNFRLAGGLPVADVAAADTPIAKPVPIRRSVVSESIDAVTITYRDALDGSADNNRIANDGAQDESQVVFPRYITYTDLTLAAPIATGAQCVIAACQPDGGTGVFDNTGKAITWLELSPARVWAKRFIA